MSKIRHLAIKSTDPTRLAKFYEEAFDMKVIHRSPSGGVYLSDGYLTMAVLRSKAEDAGIHHFGFQVDDAAATCDRVAALDVPRPTTRPSDRPYAELRATDPDGNQYDISQHGFQNVEFEPEREKKRQVS